jgi:hypothetical protein
MTTNRASKKEDLSEILNDSSTDDKKLKFKESGKTPYKPCWFIINSFKCDPDKCTFSHSSNLIDREKSKRLIEFCKEGPKCSEKCNKYHNYNELISEWKTIKNQFNSIKVILNN